MRRALAALFLLILAAAPVRAEALRWGAVLVAGSDDQGVFVTGVADMEQALARLGVADIATIGPEEARPSAVEEALAARVAGGADGCVLFMTSHGEREGLFLGPFDLAMSPKRLDAALDRTCGERPTVVILSGCYSGVYADKPVEAANRIVFTAARPDRVSFGCSNDRVHTIFDGILLEQMAKARPGATWTALAADVIAAVDEREKREGFTPPSEPQLRAGRAVESLPLQAGTARDAGPGTDGGSKLTKATPE